MTMKRALLALVLSFAVTVPLRAQDIEDDSGRRQTSNQIEPNAGKWRTWVISSAKDFRVPPPPDNAETIAELKSLAELISHNNLQTSQQMSSLGNRLPEFSSRGHGMTVRSEVSEPRC